MFDIDRVNLMLGALALPPCQDLVPRTKRTYRSAMAYGLTELETKLELSGVDHYGKARHRSPEYSRIRDHNSRMTAGDRMIDCMLALVARGQLPDSLCAEYTAMVRS